MKCSKCGKRANTIAGMAKHFRKKHPGSMKRKSQSHAAASVALRPVPSDPQAAATEILQYCPVCGHHFNPCWRR